MENLELTEDHRSKLIEMCEKLFPQYKEFELELEEQYDGSKGFLSFRNKNSNSFLDTQDVYWYEFCIRYLIPKIFQGIQEIIDCRTMFCELPNPIDYLHANFERLNGNRS